MVEKTTVLGKRKRDEKDSQPPLFEDSNLYVVKHGLRFIKPYDHEFTTFVKRRWIGKSLLDVFSAEFKAFSSDYYTRAITDGRITCNGKIVSPTVYKL